jgi:hypothetical protein
LEIICWLELQALFIYGLIGDAISKQPTIYSAANTELYVGWDLGETNFQLSARPDKHHSDKNQEIQFCNRDLNSEPP